jgi:hypothetical protein
MMLEKIRIGKGIISTKPNMTKRIVGTNVLINSTQLRHRHSQLNFLLSVINCFPDRMGQLGLLGISIDKGSNIIPIL